MARDRMELTSGPSPHIWPLVTRSLTAEIASIGPSQGPATDRVVNVTRKESNAPALRDAALSKSSLAPHKL